MKKPTILKFKKCMVLRAYETMNKKCKNKSHFEIPKIDFKRDIILYDEIIGKTWTDCQLIFDTRSKVIKFIIGHKIIWLSKYYDWKEQYENDTLKWDENTWKKFDYWRTIREKDNIGILDDWDWEDYQKELNYLLNKNIT